MQHTGKAIAEFEAWWDRQPHREQFEDLKDQMRNVAVAFYQKGLEDVVIELPAQYGIGGLASDAHDRAIAMCKDAIEAAGVTVRG